MQVPYGWGLTQLSGAEDVSFTNISSEGGVALRLENFNTWTLMDGITVDGVRCADGRAAVLVNPHTADHGTFTVTNVLADSCESAIRLTNDGTQGWWQSTSSISGVTVLPGSTAQLQDPANNRYVDAWIVGNSKYCVDNEDPLGYTVRLSNVVRGGLSNRRP